MRIAIAGNPNAGKTTLFNELTGSSQKVGNYPGVTVERKEGPCRFNGQFEFIDLPGTYSLSSVERSDDERIARNFIVDPQTDGVMVVLDASNLERQLFLATQVIDLERPTALVLTNMDILQISGQTVDVETFEELLGIPVFALVARDSKAVRLFGTALTREDFSVPSARSWKYSTGIESALAQIETECGVSDRALVRTLCGQRDAVNSSQLEKIDAALKGPFQDVLCDFRKQDILARYRWIKPLLAQVIVARKDDPKPQANQTPDDKLTERIDTLVLHRILAPLVFVAIMALLFQAVFSWSAPLSDFVEEQIPVLGNWVGQFIGASDLRSLVVDGVIVGVGNVLVFVPQIMILFFLLSLLEESGYLARAAFIMDTLFAKVGLSGRSFVPLLSSYACAVPGIMATRTIPDQRERLATILVAPLMTCSARLPIYSLIVAAFIPRHPILFGVNLQGLTFFLLYFGAAVAAYVISFVLRRTVLTGKSSEVYVEMPRYRWPHWRNVVLSVYLNSKAFIRKAGTIILLMTVFMWVLSSYPTHPNPDASAGDRLEYSAMGRIGKKIEPAFQHFGFDWKIGVALGASFVAREVAVSTLATLYRLEAETDEEKEISLRKAIAIDPQWTIWTAFSFLAFYFFSMQCMSTLAVARKETGTWGWPIFMFVYLTGIACVVSWAIHEAGRYFG